MNGKHDHTTAVCIFLRSSGDLHVVLLPAGSWLTLSSALSCLRPTLPPDPLSLSRSTLSFLVHTLLPGPISSPQSTLYSPIHSPVHFPLLGSHSSPRSTNVSLIHTLRSTSSLRSTLVSPLHSPLPGPHSAIHLPLFGPHSFLRSTLPSLFHTLSSVHTIRSTFLSQVHTLLPLASTPLLGPQSSPRFTLSGPPFFPRSTLLFPFHTLLPGASPFCLVQPLSPIYPPLLGPPSSVFPVHPHVAGPFFSTQFTLHFAVSVFWVSCCEHPKFALFMYLTFILTEKVQQNLHKHEIKWPTE